ncbi:MAG: DUF5312 family protein [Treponema sp.]
MGFFNNLLSSVKDFFMSVFFPTSPDYQQKRYLKVAEIEVRKIRPSIYRGDGFILPGFATIMFQLFQQILPIKKILANTIASKDIRLSSKYSDMLIEHEFTDEKMQTKKMLSYENRAKILEHLNQDDFDNAMQNQKKEFAIFMRSLEAEQILAIDKKIDRLFVFFDFLNYNFNKLFAKFDSAFEATIGKDVLLPNYNFGQVKGEEIIQDILDLNFLISKLVIDDNLVSAFVLLNSLVPEDAKLSDVTIEACFKEIPFILDNILKRGTLVNLIKIIKKEPNFAEKFHAVKTKSNIAEYKERASEAFNASSKKLTKLKQDKDVSALISAAFGKEPLRRVSAYNDEVNAHIQALTHMSFDWVRPLEVIKTFNLIHFERVIGVFLREVMVEGYFQNHDFQDILGVPYYYCENLTKKILEFEAKFEEKGNCSIISLEGYLEAISKGGDFRKQLSRIVDDANSSAKVLCQEAGQAYYNLFKACEALIQDAKKAVPVYITNIRALTMSIKNKESYAEFEKCMQRFSSFIEIIKNYITLEHTKTN